MFKTKTNYQIQVYYKLKKSQYIDKKLFIYHYKNRKTGRNL